MIIEFKTKNDRQIEAAEKWIDNTTEEILYGGAKGGGKSYLGAVLIFGDALIYPGTHYFIARAELIDLRKFTIPTIHEVFKNWKIDFDKYCSFNGQDNCFNLYNGSKVFLISCKDIPSDPLFERFGSMQMTRGWLEEAGEIPEVAKANLWLAIGRWKNDEFKLKKKLLITANPKKGYLKRDFVDPSKQNLLAPSRSYIQAFATDNKYLPKDYINSLKNEKDKVRRQRLWEGNWDYEDDVDSLVNADALEDAFTNTIVKDNNKYLVVDVARQGKDSTIFSFWQGLELYKVEERQKQGTEQTEQQAKDFASASKIPYSHIIVDEDGIGGGVVDHLVGVKGFTANSSPIPTSSQIREKQLTITHSLVPKLPYANLKAQCGWKLAELINEHQISFKVPEYRNRIIEELGAELRDAKMDSDKKKQLRSKEDVKKDLNGKSPDVGDTILMRMWFELKKDSGIGGPEQTIVLGKQQDQFARNKHRAKQNSSK